MKTPTNLLKRNETSLALSILVVVGLVVASSCGSDANTSNSLGAASEAEPLARDEINVTVYDPADEDDVPDPRYIWQEECGSGVALQHQEGAVDIDESIAPTDWEAALAAIDATVADASEEHSTRVPTQVGVAPASRWTIGSPDGTVLAVVTTFMANDGSWGATQPAVCQAADELS